MINALVLALLVIQSPPEKLDAYLDARWDAPAKATDDLVKSLKLDAAGFEKLLRGGRAKYPEPPQERGKLTADVPLECDHVDHETKCFVYVPAAYDPKKAASLVVIAHGGSSGRDLEFGARAARSGMEPFWLKCAEQHGFLIVAPLTDRGWGAIGNSIAMSAISKMQRDYHVDPDRIYVTGHSMGGHMSWRSAINMPDRWGAVSPMSGGYDFVKDKNVFTCFNVPGYATWGKQEPYQINDFNRIIKAWMVDHAYPWVNREKDGGHEIFEDEIEPVWEFFAKNPRNLYRAKVYARGGGPLKFNKADAKNPAWPKEHTWKEGKPIPIGTFHWLRLVPLPEDTPAESAAQAVWAVNKGGNAIEIVAENAKKLRIYLHPKMVDFAKAVSITINGKKAFEKKVAADAKTMIELAREFDDRGRIFHAMVEVDVTSSQPPPEPTFK